MIFEGVTPLDVIAQLEGGGDNLPRDQALLQAARFMLNVQMHMIYTQDTVIPLDTYILCYRGLDGSTVWVDPKTGADTKVSGITTDLWRWN